MEDREYQRMSVWMPRLQREQSTEQSVHLTQWHPYSVTLWAQIKYEFTVLSLSLMRDRIC